MAYQDAAATSVRPRMAPFSLVDGQHAAAAAGNLVIRGRDRFAAGARDQRGQGADAHAGVQKTGRAVGKHGVGPAGVKTVDLPLIRAVDGASSGTRLGLGIETLQNDPALKGSPGTALDCLVGATLAHAP